MRPWPRGEAEDRAQRRRLADAVPPEQRGDASLLDREGDALEHVRLARGRRGDRRRRSEHTHSGIPDVGRLDGLVRHHRGRRVAGEQRAVVHDGDPVGGAGHDLDVVLDHQHRLAVLDLHRLDHLDEPGHVLEADAGHRLVEQDHARVAGEHDRELELALVPVAERAGVNALARAEPDAAEGPAPALDRLAQAVRPPPDLHRPAEVGLGRETDVLQHRQAGEHAGGLERAPEPAPASAGRAGRG